MGALAILLPYYDIGRMPVGPEPVMLVGGLFVAAGLYVMGRWAWQMLAKRSQPADQTGWRADYDWQHEGEKDHQWRWIIYAISLAVALGAFSGFLYWLAQRGPENWLMPTVMYITLGVAVLALGFAGWLLFKLTLFGRTRMEYDTLPCRPGETLTARWIAPRLSRYKRLTFTLRYIEERIVVVRSAGGVGDDSGGRTRQKWYVEERWSDHYTVEAPQEVREGQAVSVVFDVPSDAYGTRLHSREPRYWEVEVHAERAGVDFAGRYLAPIYRDK